jgi:hypothetical protein
MTPESLSVFSSFPKLPAHVIPILFPASPAPHHRENLFPKNNHNGINQPPHPGCQKKLPLGKIVAE